MTDEHVEYVDEDGNVVDPAELGEDVEIVEEVEVDDEPTRSYEDADELAFEVDDDLDGLDVEIADEPVVTSVSRPVVEQSSVEPPAVLSEPEEHEEVEQAGQSPSFLDGRGKAVLLGAGAAVVAVVAGLAFGLGAIGDQNTVSDVKAGAQSKYAQASSAVVSKSSAVRGETSEALIDTCTPAGLAGAMASGSGTSKLRLDVVGSVPLPGAFIAARTNADGREGTPSLLQLTKTNWGAYTTVPLTRAEKKAEVDRPGFWKADVQVNGDKIAVAGDRVWSGGDQGGAGSCEPGEPGVYAATGKVPADAQGLVDGQASVDAIQGIAGEPDKAVALMGNSIALVKVIETPAEPAGK